MNILFKRPDGSFVIELNGLPYQVIQSDPLYAETKLEADAMGAALGFEPTPTPPAPSVPQSVSNAQARAALMASGQFAQVDTFIKNSGNAVALMAWEYANFVDRHGTLVTALAPQFGFTDAQLDALFIAASQIVL